MSTRAPAARAGGSPAGDAPATIVTEPRFARPFRGAAAAASLGTDAGCQTEPLPQLEPLRRLRDARVASLRNEPEENSSTAAEKPSTEKSGVFAHADAADDAADHDSVFVRRRRRSSSVERENAALEIERVSAADFERRVAARREALVETGVLEGAKKTREKAGARRARHSPSDEISTESERSSEKNTRPGARHPKPEPPRSGSNPKPSPTHASPLVVRRKPRALDVGAQKSAGRAPRTAHEKKNSLSGDGDFIAFDTTLPVPPASPSERDGRARGPTPAGREGLSLNRTCCAGADSAASAPASPDSPDWDDREPFPFPSRRRGVAIAGGASRGRRSPGRRVVSPGANGTLHFGSAAPSGLNASRARVFAAESPSTPRVSTSTRDAASSAPAKAVFLFRAETETAPPRDDGVSGAALVPPRGETPSAEAVGRTRSDPAPRKPKPASVSSLSRGLGSLSGLAGAARDGEETELSGAARFEKNGALARAGTSAFAVVTKEALAPPPRGVEPARARGGVSEETRKEDRRSGSRARKSVLTMSLRGERSP